MAINYYLQLLLILLMHVQALNIEYMPAVEDWPEDGRMDYHGERYKIKNQTEDPFPYVLRHQPGLSKTALLLQIDLCRQLDRTESEIVPGRMTPKRYVACLAPMNELAQ